MSSNAKAWLHSLVAAAIGAAANGVTLVIVAPDTFNFTAAGMLKLGTVCAVSALIAVAGFLKQSPLPEDPPPPSAGGASKVLSLLLAFTVLFGTLPTTGCTISSAQVKSDGAAIAQAALSIAAQIAPTNPALAAQITTAANALTAITSNWTVGSGVTLFNDAANALEIVLAAIPVTAPYAVLVGFAVAAIDILIANLNPTAAASVKASLARTEPANLTAYRLLGQKKLKHRFGRSLRGDFKASWNQAIADNALQPSMAFN